MGYNKFMIKGSDTPLLDLTQDTVSKDTLLMGTTAHDKFGNLITGALVVDASEKYTLNWVIKQYKVNSEAPVVAGDFVEFVEVTDPNDTVKPPDVLVQPTVRRTGAIGIAKTGGSAGEQIEVYCVTIDKEISGETL
jgi:hypothetical protein